MSTPSWVQDAVFYQIFPDRFANGDASIDPPNVQPWGSQPSLTDFQGGDLRGITQRLDYLADLGITGIYLNPIFAATSNHRYNTSDYHQIDPRLGSLDDFRALVEAAHHRGMYIILDGVFNHCGRGFFPFVDVLENGERSGYRDWFHIRRFPLDAYGSGEAHNYLAWWNFKSLPKLNIANPEVRRYVLCVARYWIEQGADGWRLDVPNEIDDDGFWQEVRGIVKGANPEAYLVGEIWEADARWANETHFDGLMNYPARGAVLALLQGREGPSRFADSVEGLLQTYPRDNAWAMYNMLGSHDTERIATLLQNDLDKLRMAYLFLLTYPGVPALYYGDEIGLEGGKDPDSRRAFPWDEQRWNRELLDWIRSLIALRKRIPSLRRGDFVRLLADEGSYAFARKLGPEAAAVALNVSAIEQQIRVPCAALGWRDGQELRSLLDGRSLSPSGGELSFRLAPWTGICIAEGG
jgi:glycosidase